LAHSEADQFSAGAAFQRCGSSSSIRLTSQDPKQYLFFTRTPSGIHAAQSFPARLKERTRNRDKEIAVRAYVAQLQALDAWGNKKPADLSVIKQHVLVINGDSDWMVQTPNSYDLVRRLPNSALIIYPDASHGGRFKTALISCQGLWNFSRSAAIESAVPRATREELRRDYPARSWSGRPDYRAGHTAARLPACPRERTSST
jgi:hypothetical protein